MARKPNEKFLEELKLLNPYDISPIEEYQGATTKILVHCNVCDFEWQTTPNSLLSKKVGCPKCNGTYQRTHEDFVKELSEKNSKVSVVGEFVSTSVGVKVKCNDCGRVWISNPSNLLKGVGCNRCASPLKRSHDNFIKEVNKNNPYVKILGKYQGVEHKILVKCTCCNKEYMAYPQKLLKCIIHRPCNKILTPPKKYDQSKTHEQFLDDLNKLGKNIKLLSRYENRKTKIHVECLDCGRTWWALPSVLLRENSGNGCIDCSTKRISENMCKSHDTFVNEVSKINPHITIVSKYNKQTEKVKVKCSICGHEHYILPDKLLSRIYNCPVCSEGTSFPNRFMTSLLSKNHIEFYPEKKFDWSMNKRYDFYIPKTSTIIEMHGEQHYIKKYDGSIWGEDLSFIQNNDNEKIQLALNNGIKNYVIIDSRTSTGEFIANSIKESSISFLLDDVVLSDVLRDCLFNTKIKRLADLYNSGITKNIELRKELGVCKETCKRYIELAKEAKLIA